jgi:predicted enzyme related to lactoylglutathione lyase
MSDIFRQIIGGAHPARLRTVTAMDNHHGHLSHFAINSDDLGASRRFYEATFGWRFEPWGPPDFFHILTADGARPGPIGALQGRRSLVSGQPTIGYECTITVADAEATAAAARAAGGKVLMEKTTISGVGDLVFLLDPSGNAVGAMRYDEAAD